MSILDKFATSSVVLFTVACLVTDIRRGRLPNWLTVPMFALGFLVHTVADRWPGLQFSFLGFVTGFGLLFVLLFIGGGGGGDLKMMSALGSWLGAVLTVEAFLASAVIALFIMLGGMVYAAIAKRPGPRAERRGRPAGVRRKAARVACCRMRFRSRWPRGLLWPTLCGEPGVCSERWIKRPGIKRFNSRCSGWVGCSPNSETVFLSCGVALCHV